MTVEITDANIKDVIASGKPVVVDFWAAWCGPCKMMGPVIAELAENHPELVVGKVNVDEQPDLAAQFNVMSIPFIAAFKDGKMIKSSIGVKPAEELLSLFNA